MLQVTRCHAAQPGTRCSAHLVIIQNTVACGAATQQVMVTLRPAAAARPPPRSRSCGSEPEGHSTWPKSCWTDPPAHSATVLSLLAYSSWAGIYISRNLMHSLDFRKSIPYSHPHFTFSSHLLYLTCASERDNKRRKNLRVKLQEIVCGTTLGSNRTRQLTCT